MTWLLFGDCFFPLSTTALVPNNLLLVCNIIELVWIGKMGLRVKAVWRVKVVRRVKISRRLWIFRVVRIFPMVGNWLGLAVLNQWLIESDSHEASEDQDHDRGQDQHGRVRCQPAEMIWYIAPGLKIVTKIKAIFIKPLSRIQISCAHLPGCLVRWNTPQ